MESDDFVLKEDSGAVDGIAYVIETYGIIYNKALLKKYCEMDGAVIKSADEINNFETLKKVADDIQAKKDDLGVDGAFTSAGFDSSSDWRFKTHLANLPIYYEYKADGIDDTDAIKGTYLDQYKNVFDLYITDSTCDGSELSAKTADDSRNEFVNGRCSISIRMVPGNMQNSLRHTAIDELCYDSESTSALTMRTKVLQLVQKTTGV